MKGHFTMSSKEADRIPVIERLLAGEIKAKHAARELNLSVRQIRRLKKRYKREGAAGLAHKNRGRASNHRIPSGEIDRAVEIIKERYWDFGPTLALEKLKKHHGVTFSRETLRKAMIEASVWKVKKQKRPRIHQMRERRACEGELVQLDGSPHAWFEDRGPKRTLLVFIDDATGKLLHLLFVKSESIDTYFEAMETFLKKHGKPLAFYLDRHGVFRVNTSKGGTASSLDSTGITQFGRAMDELKIELIFANSPEAKGRVEKVNFTLQDRLVKELRLLGISNMEAANSYLPKFIKEFNSKFAVCPKKKQKAYRPLLPSDNFRKILVKRYTRTLSRNLEISYKNIRYQIQTDRPTYAMRHARVIVTEDRFGKVRIYYKGKKLKYKVLVKRPKAEIVDTKKLNPKIDEIKLNKEHQAVLINKLTKPKWKPAPNHPWRQSRTFLFGR